MVGSLSAGLLLADEAGAHLPSVDDFLPPEILFQGTPFAINRIILFVSWQPSCCWWCSA